MGGGKEVAENGLMTSARGGVRRLLGIAEERFSRGGWPALGWAARLTAAAVSSFVVAHAIFPHTEPLLAPLTALLVVQLTPVSLLASGVDRVLSVVAGVAVAATFATFVELTWWSLAIVIAVSILVGQVLRLGANLIEVPISAMLVLGVGSLAAESAAWQRVGETLVGATVGVVSNLLFPPRVRVQDAVTAIEGLADDLARLLDRAGTELEDQALTARPSPTPRRAGSTRRAGSPTTSRTSAPPCCAPRRAGGSTCAPPAPPMPALACDTGWRPWSIPPLPCEA